MLERPLSSVTNQSLCHHTVRSWLLDQRVSSKESPKPWLDLHTIWFPESKDFSELKQTTSGKIVFQDVQTRPTYLSHFYFSFLEENALYLHFPISSKRGRPPLIMIFSEPASLWSCEPFRRVRSFRIHKSLSFIWTIKWLWILMQIHGFWIYNLTDCFIW